MNFSEGNAGVPYVKPEIETLTDRDILEELGPAQAYTQSFPFDF